MRFYLGTHRPRWLGMTDVPLFVSRRTLGRKRLPRARGPWSLDSGGFSELNMYGEWRTTSSQYVDEVRLFRDEIGRLDWAAVQDWMCEPHIIARTGLTVAEHQTRTIASYLDLQSLAPDLPWTPVIQGWENADYHRHVEAYARAGIDLTTLPIVGIGSVCRRQGSGEIARLIRSVSALGIRLHGFGVKSEGLRRVGRHLASADSMAWSFVARRRGIILPHCRGHKNCANCLDFALSWRSDLLDTISIPRAEQEEQLGLFDVA